MTAAKTPAPDEIPLPLPSDSDLTECEYTGRRCGVCRGCRTYALLAEERRQSAAVREVCRAVLGKEPCPRCTGRADHQIYCGLCSSTGTRDVIDGCGLVEAVERALKELQTTSAFFDADHQVTLMSWSQARDLWHKERSGLIAAVETMRERAAKVADDEAAMREKREYTHRRDGGEYEARIQGHKAITASAIATAIRDLPLEPTVKEPTP